MKNTRPGMVGVGRKRPMVPPTTFRISYTVQRGVAPAQRMCFTRVYHLSVNQVLSLIQREVIGSAPGSAWDFKVEVVAEGHIIKRSPSYAPTGKDPDCPTCKQIGDGFGPSHNGHKGCKSGAPIEGGTNTHCSCDHCF